MRNSRPADANEFTSSVMVNARQRLIVGIIKMTTTTSPLEVKENDGACSSLEGTL
jgi:hypothetical protein